MPHIAVDLTHVRHLEDDPLGPFMAWMSLVPVFIALSCFPTLYFFRRDLRTMFFGMGLLMSDIVNQVIKHYLKQPRPPSCEILEACDSHGMPSGHTQFMCFFATFISLLAIRKRTLTSNLWKLFVVLLPWPFALLTGCSRVYLGYHSFPQVVAGGSIGVLLGATWFWFVAAVASPYFPAMSDSALGAYLCIKDDSHIPDVALFEYNNSRAARVASLTYDDSKKAT